MEQVPKIVSQRLQATAKPADHPDANVLAGFAEKSLTERERVQVMDHLGQCLDCREVVSAAVMLRRERSASTEPFVVASQSRTSAPAVASENKATETAATPTVSGGLPAANSALPSLQASSRDLTVASPNAKQLARSEALKGRAPASPPAATPPNENTAAELAEGAPPQLESRASRYQKKRELHEGNETVEVGGEAALLNSENAKVAPETETVTVMAQ